MRHARAFRFSDRLHRVAERERDLIAEIQARMTSSSYSSSYSLAGRLELPHLAALLERAPLLLANNTGPVHLAAAVGTPVVDLYALTNPQHTPWGVPCRVLYEDVPCRFCLKSVCPEAHNGCLHWVTPERVAAAVRRASTAPLSHPTIRPLPWNLRWILCAKRSRRDRRAHPDVRASRRPSDDAWRPSPRRHTATSASSCPTRARRAFLRGVRCVL